MSNMQPQDMYTIKHVNSPYTMMRQRFVHARDAPRSTSTKPASKLANLLSDNREIRDMIVSNLDQKDILFLTKVNKETRLSVMSERRNVDARLRRFFARPTAFRQELGRSNAMISGSFALQFFQNVTWTDSDLNVFAMCGEDANQLAEYLVSEESYCSVDDTDPNTFRPDQICRVRNYERKSKQYGRTKVQIAETIGTPLEVVLTGSYASNFVNFITWDAAYSMFPNATLIDHKMYMLASLDDKFGAILAKYARRGWTTLDLVDGDGMIFDHEELGSRDQARRLLAASLGILTFRPSPQALIGGEGSNSAKRRVGDRHTYKIALDTEGISVPGPYYNVENCSFCVARQGLNPTCHNITTERFKHPLLRHQYNVRLDQCFLWSDFYESLNRMLVFEIAKVPAADRPEGCTEILGFAEPRVLAITEAWTYGGDQWDEWDDWKKPDSWQFMDHLITRFAQKGDGIII